MAEQGIKYLDYLDKEMTIMGILSTFCVAAASLVIERTGRTESDWFFQSLRNGHLLSVFCGSAALMAAGLCFYLQRSKLAHFYGSICMSMAQPGYHEWNTSRWLLEAYSWFAWIRYRIGFIFLMTTSVLYTHATYRTLLPDAPACKGWAWAALGAVLVAAVAQVYILWDFRYQPHPYKAFWHVWIRRDWPRDPRSKPR